MRILERYINNTIIATFLATIFIFCFLYILIDATSTLDEIINRKIPLEILINYYLSFVPIIFVQTSPIASLIATLFTFSSLNNHNEIIVMRSSGLNFWQITRPAIVFGILISVIVLLINEKIVPQATIKTEQIREENMVLKADRMRSKEKIKNMTFYGLQNRLYFIDSFDPQTFDLDGVTIIEHDEDQNIRQKIVTFKGVWTGIAWKFYQCQITAFGEDNKTNTATKVFVYKEKLMDIKETPQDFLRQQLNVSAMNIRQLHQYINRFSKSGANTALNNLRVDMHQKIASPFGNIVIILVGLPFAVMIQSRRRSTFSSLGIAIAIGFFYFVANAVCLAFGKGGLFPPFIAAWTAPFLFSVAAFFLIEERF